MTGEQLKQGYNNVFINNEKQSKSIQEILDSIEHSKLYFSVDDQATMVIFEAAKNKESPELRTAGMNALYECIHRYILNLVTKKYESFGNWMEDMINEAYIAILENITDYNPSKGKPTTYFELIIKNQMNQFISKNILHTTPHYARIDRRIWNAMMALESQGIKVNAVNIQRICKDMTLEQIMSSQERLDQMKEEYTDEYNSMDRLMYEDTTPETIYIQQEERNIISQVMNRILTVTEKQILLWKYEYEGECSEQVLRNCIAEKLGLTSREVRSYEIRALRKLHQALSKVLFEDEEQALPKQDDEIFDHMIIPFNYKKKKKTEKLFEINLRI